MPGISNRKLNDDDIITANAQFNHADQKQLQATKRRVDARAARRTKEKCTTSSILDKPKYYRSLEVTSSGAPRFSPVFDGIKAAKGGMRAEMRRRIEAERHELGDDYLTPEERAEIEKIRNPAPASNPKRHLRFNTEKLDSIRLTRR